MKNLLTIAAVLLLLLGPGTNKAFTQTKKSVAYCKQTVFAAFKPLPKMEYACPADLIDSDNKILKLPERIAAIKEVTQQLRALANPAWWRANVDDLDPCEIHGSAGALTDEEKAHFTDRDYQFLLFGNQQIRVVLVYDPCYQTGYNGSDMFGLDRVGDEGFGTVDRY